MTRLWPPVFFRNIFGVTQLWPPVFVRDMFGVTHLWPPVFLGYLWSDPVVDSLIFWDILE